MLERYSHIIWDFNGTIVDDVQLGIEAVNSLLQKRGLPLITDRDRYYGVFRYPIIDYYTELGFDFTKESFDTLAKEWFAIYDARCGEAPLQPGVREALQKAKALGKKQIIISASERGLMMKQLALLGVEDLFDEVIGADNIYGESKIEAAKRWAAAEKPEKALFIGDLSHDRDTAEAIGADCVLIARGHESRAALERHGVTVLGSAYELL